MSTETATVEKKEKTPFFKGLKQEFKKIIWPEKKSAVHQVILIIVCAVIIGVLVSLLDSAIGSLIGLIS